VKTTRAFQLIDLRRPQVYNLASDGKKEHAPEFLSAWTSEYAVTTQWAQALHDRITDADGLIYESHQRPGNCYLIWGTFPKNPFQVIGKAVSVSAQPVRGQLIRAANGVGAAVDFD